MAARHLIKYCIDFLEIIGANPKKSSSTLDVIKLCSILGVLVHLAMEITLQYIFNWKGWKAADPLLNYLAVIQAATKLSFISLRRTKLKHLLGNMELFWNWNDFNGTVKNSINPYLFNTKRSLQLFGVLIFIAISTYEIKPLITKDGSLPFDTYHPVNRSSSQFYPVMYTLQILQGTFTSISLFIFDCLFVLFILNIFCEIKMLKIKLAKVNVNMGVANRIKYLVDHHSLILGCIRDMNTTYSGILLVQVFSSILGVCVSILAILSEGFPPALGHVIKYIPFIGTIVIQLFIYCYLGTFLLSETDTVSEAVYDSEWWAKTQPEFRKVCVLMILRSNNNEELLAGGLFRLNLESFTNVMKFALSFFTLTVQMREDHFNM